MGIERIEHVVVFMLENRSFDSLLGWLYEQESPCHNLPPVAPGERAYDGLHGLDLNRFANSAGGLSVAPRRGASGLNVPQIDPGESFAHVNVQLFEKAVVEAGDLPSMRGYLRDYLSILADHKDYDPAIFGPMVMESYTPAQLPVLNDLARHYAVSDRWFCSVPSQTNCNRAFSVCGTSMGLVDNGYLEADPRRVKVEQVLRTTIGDDRITAPTIWNVLHDRGFNTTEDWMIFWQCATLPEKIHAHLHELAPIVGADGAAYLGELSSGALDSCYTYRLFPRLHDIPDIDRHFARIDEFHRRARSGTLPSFSYIEPRWNLQVTAVSDNPDDPSKALEHLFTQTGNDYHPPGNVAAGEEFLREIYLSLIADDAAWRKTLLVITVDEAVGQFDHVPPPGATPPWGARAPRPGVDVQSGPQYGFNFDRYGARVPTILVSPLIPKGTVVRAAGNQPFDHTSLIAQILERFGLSDLRANFGERTAGAPTFAQVLTLTDPRSDARDIGFLVSERQLGDDVRYFDRFYLRGTSGQYISQAQYRPKTGDGTKEYFPTIGPGVMLHFERALERDSTSEITSGQLVKIVTADAEVGAYNVLGNWPDAAHCYYYNDYLAGEHNEQETWVIQRPDGGTRIQFGDPVVLTSRFAGGVLTAADGALAARPGATATWVILPPVP